MEQQDKERIKSLFKSGDSKLAHCMLLAVGATKKEYSKLICEVVWEEINGFNWYMPLDNYPTKLYLDLLGKYKLCVWFKQKSKILIGSQSVFKIQRGQGLWGVTKEEVVTDEESFFKHKYKFKRFITNLAANFVNRILPLQPRIPHPNDVSYKKK
jgi:hypothetical protein